MLRFSRGSPHDRVAHSYALRGQLDDPERLVRDYQDILGPWMEAALETGHYAEIQARVAPTEAFAQTARLHREGLPAARALLADPACTPRAGFAALLMLGRSNEAMALAEAKPTIDATPARLQAGQPGPQPGRDLHERLLLTAWRLDEAWNLGWPDGSPVTDVSDVGKQRLRLALVLDALMRKDSATALRWRKDLVSRPDIRENEDLAVAQYFLLPLLDQITGRQGALDEACRAVISEDRAWNAHRLRYLARYILGIDDETAFLAQPKGLARPFLLLVARALRAERTCQTKAIRAAWQAVLQATIEDRGGLAMPMTRRCAAWRGAPQP